MIVFLRYYNFLTMFVIPGIRSGIGSLHTTCCLCIFISINKQCFRNLRPSNILTTFFYNLFIFYTPFPFFQWRSSASRSFHHFYPIPAFKPPCCIICKFTLLAFCVCFSCEMRDSSAVFYIYF